MIYTLTHPKNFTTVIIFQSLMFWGSKREQLSRFAMISSMISNDWLFQDCGLKTTLVGVDPGSYSSSWEGLCKCPSLGAKEWYFPTGVWAELWQHSFDSWDQDVTHALPNKAWGRRQKEPTSRPQIGSGAVEICALELHHWEVWPVYRPLFINRFMTSL